MYSRFAARRAPAPEPPPPAVEMPKAADAPQLRVPAEPVNLLDVHMRNVTLRGGVAPVRAYIPEMLGDVLADRLDPSPVLDLTVPLEGVPEGYAAMDERRAIKALVAVS